MRYSQRRMERTRDQLEAEIRELTDVKRELEVAQEMNRRISEAMPGGLVRVARDGSILHANAAAQKILGLSYDDLTNKYVADFETETLREDGSPCPVEDYPVSKALATGEPQPPMLIGVRRPDGEISWTYFTAAPLVQVDGKGVDGAIVTFLDITEHLKTEALLRSVLDSAPNLIVLTDLQGRVVFANHYEGIPHDELIGRDVFDFVHPDDQARVRENIARVISESAIEEYETRSAGGLHPALYRVRAAPVRQGSAVTGIALVAWDLTRTRELEARVHASNRLASLGTLAASVAHEVNNPLTYFFLNLHRLDEGLPASDADLREALEQLGEGAERIRSVVSDLSTLSSPEESQNASVDINTVLESSLRMATNELRHRARVERALAAAPKVWGSASRLGQVFLNLIVNAAQSIPHGNAENNVVRISTRREPGSVIVEVEDTGAGIPPELRERVFEPFATSKGPHQGRGLGLYICKDIVASMGGTIGIESLPRGTRFRVTLPESAHAELASPASAVVAATDPARILVVDDEPHIRTSVARLLGAHDVVVARSGREAIERLETDGLFDLVLCDIIMPDKTGIDVYRHCATTSPGSEGRIVFMSGGVFDTATQELLESIPNPLLSKPFRASELHEVVNRLLTESS